MERFFCSTVIPTHDDDVVGYDTRLRTPTIRMHVGRRKVIIYKLCKRGILVFETHRFYFFFSSHHIAFLGESKEMQLIEL